MLTDYAKSLLERKAAAPRPAQLSDAASQAGADGLAPADAIPAALAAYPQRMSVRQVAEYLALSDDQITLFRDSGGLLFINLAANTGGHPLWRIDRASVAAFERKRAVKPQA
jgi:hypothetical protein